MEISKDYAYCLAVASAMSAQVFLTGGSVVGIRKKYNIEYPDMGNGRYSAKLTDDQWLEFNNYQRAHYNYVEQIASVLALELISGIFFPRWAACWGAVYIVGRALYSRAYQKKGPKARRTGATLLNLALVVLCGTSAYGCYKTLAK